MKTILTILILSALSFSAHAVQIVTLPVGVAATGAQNENDLSSLKGTVGFVLTAKSIAGTNPTAAIKLQSSPPLATGHSVMTGTTAGVALRTAADTAIELAASLTTPDNAVTPSIKRIVLPLKKHAGLTAGTLTVVIKADSSGPTGSALQTATFNVANLTDAFQGITFDFLSPATLAADTKYWIVLSSAYTEHATNNVTWRTTTVASGGNASVFGTGWVASATNNLNFRTDQYVFSDVTGGAFTALTTIGSIQEITLPIQNFGSAFRTHLTIGGTDSPQYIIGVSAKQLKP